MKKVLLFSLIFLLAFSTCKKEPDPTTDAVLRIKFRFSPTQQRLDSFGNPSTLPANHGAQTPAFHGLSVHFIEVIPNEWTLYKSGEQLYMGSEVPANNANPFGFTTAIKFDEAIIKAEGETFLEIPLKDIAPGTYRHLRASVTYQNYSVSYNLRNIPVVGDLNNQTGTIASFVGFNTFINTLTVNQMQTPVNAAKLQGFWAFETALQAPYNSYNQIITGEAPQSATTVVNPFPNAPIPLGSCVVSGDLDKELVVTGDEETDINLTLSFSINQSFEWIDTDGNGEWDIDLSGMAAPELVTDMGLRGMVGIVE